MKTKKTGMTDGEPNKLGGGGRFKQMVNSGKSPALTAFIGRKMYGKKKMASMAAKGKKKAEKAPMDEESTESQAPKGIAIGKPMWSKK